MNFSSRSSFSRSTLTRESDLHHSEQQQEETQREDAADAPMGDEADEADDEAARARAEYRAGLARRVAAYEQCVEAVGVLTASLEELSAKIEVMKTSTQQLNAFTSGWLTVWQRSA